MPVKNEDSRRRDDLEFLGEMWERLDGYVNSLDAGARKELARLKHEEACDEIFNECLGPQRDFEPAEGAFLEHKISEFVKKLQWVECDDQQMEV